VTDNTSWHNYFPPTVRKLSFHTYRFFKESSDEEREHAEKLMKYQVLLVLPSTL
jgi:hypothetical protein